MDRRTLLLLSPAALTLSCTSAPRLTVGAKNFTEQDILGEILIQHLTRKLGQIPSSRLHLGGSFVAHQALIDGAIDLYPEYSGTALTACLKLPLDKDPKSVLDAVRTTYASRHNVTFGWPLGFANTFALVMRKAEADSLGIRTLSDAAQKRKGWKLGVGYEFEQRPDGWPSFRQSYPLDLQGGLITMDLGLLYRALESNQADLVAGNSTDPALASGKFVALEDDLHFFPPYDTCLAVRQQALQTYPQLQSALDALAGKVTLERMRAMNANAVLRSRSAAEIAAQFVSSL